MEDATVKIWYHTKYGIVLILFVKNYLQKSVKNDVSSQTSGLLFFFFLNFSFKFDEITKNLTNNTMHLSNTLYILEAAYAFLSNN